MAKKIHFISGLPRSGSTLLSAILRQNPRFHASMSGPVGSLFNALMQAMSARAEFSEFIQPRQREKILRSVFEAFYDEIDAEVVFDTNRMWTSKLQAILTLFPGAKVICTVRNPAWIMDSIERMVRKNSLVESNLFGGANESRTVYHRVETLAKPDRFLGFPYYALKDAFYSDHASALLIVDYEFLARSPEQVIPLVYDFLGEPLYDHDFGQVEYDEPDFDAKMGLPGLHQIRPKVAFEPRKTILPPDLFNKFKDQEFWKDLRGSTANVITASRQHNASSPAISEVD